MFSLPQDGEGSFCSGACLSAQTVGAVRAVPGGISSTGRTHHLARLDGQVELCQLHVEFGECLLDEVVVSVM